MCDYISREDAKNALLNKGQHTTRYRLGETWELNFMEILEALDTIPAVEIKSIDNVAVLGLERHNIKRAYPDFTDREVAAYKMGFEECRTSILEVVMKYCPDDDGTCSKLGADLRELLDDIENI